MRQVVETVVGLCVVMLTGALLFYSYAIQGERDLGYTLVAYVNDVAGLSTGADVCVGGVKVGVVSAITLDSKSYRALLKLSMREDVALPVDTSLAIESASLLGGKYVSLTPGSETDCFKPDDRIAMTSGAMSFEKMLLSAFVKK